MKPVQLFVTCMVDAFRPEAGIAAARVLERRGAALDFPADQTCCGQFSFNAGYHHEAARLARHFVHVFEGTEGSIVALSGSCAAMVIHEYPSLIAEDVISTGGTTGEAADWKERAVRIGDRVVELSQWITQFTENSPEVPNPVVSAVLHQGCHMRRLLKANVEPEAVLRQAGINPITMDDADQCCGFGGTYSMTEWKVSTALADAKWYSVKKTIHEHNIACLTSADLGCLLHLEGRQSRLGETFPVMYLAELIDRADQGMLMEKGETDGWDTSR
jgi:L-lactate dehydrogenase complex protein LldE